MLVTIGNEKQNKKVSFDDKELRAYSFTQGGGGNFFAKKEPKKVTLF